MSMFDLVNLKYPIENLPNVTEWQTKSLTCRLVRYTINEQGQLVITKDELASLLGVDLLMDMIDEIALKPADDFVLEIHGLDYHNKTSFKDWTYVRYEFTFRKGIVYSVEKVKG